eukprot:10197260-Ditylum_brightwellii.AAC.1
MDPCQEEFQHHLPKISKIKEMLTACVYPMMKTYWLKGSMIHYKGGDLSIEQDICGSLSSLPQRIDKLSIMIVQK